MACICSSTPVTPEKVCQVTGLTEAEKKVVRDTWYNARAEWGEKYGPAFFTRLFKKHKDIMAYFQSEQAQTVEDILKLDSTKKHVTVFGVAVTSLVDNLSRVDVLVEAIKKLTDSHVARGVTVKNFEVALNEMVKFMCDNFGSGKKVKKSWEKTTKVIMKVILDHSKTL